MWTGFVVCLIWFSAHVHAADIACGTGGTIESADVPRDCEIIQGTLLCDDCDSGILASLAVRHILGDLRITAVTAPTRISMPFLERVGGDIVAEDCAIHYMDFVSLRVVSGSVKIVNNEAQKEFRAPALTEITISLDLDFMTALEVLELTSLQTAGNIFLQYAAVLPVADFPNLVSIGSKLTVRDCSNMTVVNMPALAEGGNEWNIKANHPAGVVANLYSLRFLGQKQQYDSFALDGVKPGGLRACPSALSVQEFGGFATAPSKCDPSVATAVTAPGWPNVSQALIGDICAGSTASRVANVNGIQCNEPSAGCTWEALGCFLVFKSDDWLHLDCSNVGLSGALNVEAIGWTDLPDWAPLPISSIDFSNNNITLLRYNSLNCFKAGLESLVSVDLSNNPIDFVHTSLLKGLLACPNLAEWTPIKSARCPEGTLREPRSFGSSETIVFVCECLEGTYCPDDGDGVVRCPKDEYLDKTVCLPCPGSWVSDAGSFSIDQCQAPVANLLDLDLISAILAFVFVLGCAVYGVVVAVKFGTLSTTARPLVVYIPILAVAATVADCLFIVEAARIPAASALAFASAMALAVPFTLNLLATIIFWSVELTSGDLNVWFTKNVTMLLPVFVLTILNVSCIHLVSVDMFDQEVTRAPLSAKTFPVMMGTLLISNHLQIVPQLIMKLIFAMAYDKFTINVEISFIISLLTFVVSIFASMCSPAMARGGQVRLAITALRKASGIPMEETTEIAEIVDAAFKIVLGADVATVCEYLEEFDTQQGGLPWCDDDGEADAVEMSVK